MVDHLEPCPGCGRHVRVSERECPFCSEALDFSGTPAPLLPTARMSRGQIASFRTLVGVGLVSASAAGLSSGCSDDLNAVPVYGAPCTPESCGPIGGTEPVGGTQGMAGRIGFAGFGAGGNAGSGGNSGSGAIAGAAGNSGSGAGGVAGAAGSSGAGAGGAGGISGSGGAAGDGFGGEGGADGLGGEGGS